MSVPETGVVPGTPPVVADAPAPAAAPTTTSTPVGQPDANATAPEPQEPSWLGPRLQREREKAEREIMARHEADLRLTQRLRQQGLDPDAALRQMDQYEAEQRAQQLGVPAPVAQELSRLQSQVASLSMRDEEMALREELTRGGIDPKEYDRHATEVRAFRASNPGARLDQAFWATVGPKQRELAKLEGQQAALANVMGRDGKATERSDAAAATIAAPDLRDRKAVTREQIEQMAREVMSRGR